MNLEEKFEDAIGLSLDSLTKQCVQICDEFAVGFSEWLIIKCDYMNHGVWCYKGIEYTQTELLEIYKQGL